MQQNAPREGFVRSGVTLFRNIAGFIKIVYQIEAILQLFGDDVQNGSCFTFRNEIIYK